MSKSSDALLAWVEKADALPDGEKTVPADAKDIAAGFAALSADDQARFLHLLHERSVVARLELVRAIAKKTDPDLLRFLSPLGWEHINLTGDFTGHAPTRSTPANTGRYGARQNLTSDMLFFHKPPRVGFDTLGLQTYLTAGPKETRVWTIHRGDTAPRAAGVIHTDFQRGFIKAEVVSFEDLIDAGSMAEAKSRGKVRIEGKEYGMADGDVVEFRFNV
ncbi:Protein of unknown function [Arthrobacter alpinus]|uniref:YchF C-terminal domain-containing protein n=1 Tax=Arthrobacter alpinus TaxID=656366 RepID=A0A1H5PED0_9MICC|nr:Protein of unknown function [Arthrobacter alpinus]